MVLLSNRRLGPAAELLVSPPVAAAALRAVAAAGRPAAEARWEHELVHWLEGVAAACGGRAPAGLDVADIAWTPEHFERQRAFVLAAIAAAGAGLAPQGPEARALAGWASLIAAHPRESVSVGRRWRWPDSLATA